MERDARRTETAYEADEVYGRSIDRPWRMLRELADQLGAAQSLKTAGRALLAVSRQCGVSRLLIVGPPNEFGGPVLFDSDVETGLSDSGGSTKTVPVSIAGAVPDQPWLVSSGRMVEVAAGGNVESRVGFVVPVRVEGQLVWCAIFAGHREAFDEGTCSILCVGVHAAHSRLFETAPRRRGNLTLREHQVLQWIAGGKTDVEVGAILSISPRTVRFHMSNIKKKLGVVTRIQAVALQAVPN